MAPVKSSLWKYFHKNSTDKTASCRICFKTIKTCGNTTNLKNHISRMHPGFLTAEGFEKPRPDKFQPTMPAFGRTVTNPISDEIGEASPSTSSAGHQLENPVEIILSDIQEDEPGSPVLSRSSTPTVCAAKATQQTQIKDAFRKITSYSEGGSKNAKITNAIMYMICRDLLPLSHVEDQGFRLLMKVTAPLYTVPSRRKITTMLDEKYELLANVYKNKLAATDHVTLTADIWSEPLNTKSFMGVTVHRLQETNLVSATIGVVELKESHTAENISRVLLSTCDEWNIDSQKVTAVVTDNAANMVKGVCNAFTRKKHLPCFAHTLNLVPIKAIELTKGLPERMSQIKSIVTWFKHSVSGADMLRKVQMESGRCEGNVLKLKQDIPTRWNSCFYMLDQFLKLRDHVTVVLIKFPQAPPMLTASQLEEVKEVIELLKPIESMSKELSGSTYVTCSKIIPLVNCLEAHIEATKPRLEMSCHLKKHLQDEVQKRFGKTEGVTMLAQATLLDPRFKKLHFRDPLCCSQAIKNVASILREHQSEDERLKGTSMEVMEPEPQGDKFDLWHHHKQLVAKKMGTSQTEEGVPIELSHYLGSNMSPLESDPIQEWHKFKATYPVLFKIAMKYLPVVATSVPSECLFSKAGNIMTQKRNRITGKRLSKLIFLNSLNESHWGF